MKRICSETCFRASEPSYSRKNNRYATFSEEFGIFLGRRGTRATTTIWTALRFESEGDSGRIYCVWGEFTIHREEIKKGVRFTLPNCPNSFAWTITNDDDHVTIHSTMHPSEHDADFIETIEVASEDWRTGVTAAIEAL